MICDFRIFCFPQFSCIKYECIAYRPPPAHQHANSELWPAYLSLLILYMEQPNNLISCVGGITCIWTIEVYGSWRWSSPDDTMLRACNQRSLQWSRAVSEGLHPLQSHWCWFLLETYAKCGYIYEEVRKGMALLCSIMFSSLRSYRQILDTRKNSFYFVVEKSLWSSWARVGNSLDVYESPCSKKTSEEEPFKRRLGSCPGHEIGATSSM